MLITINYSLDDCESKIEVVLDNMLTANKYWLVQNDIGLKNIAIESINEVQECNYQTLNGEFPLDGKILNLKLLLRIIETIGDNPFL